MCRSSDRVVLATVSGSSVDPGQDASRAAAHVQVFYPGARGGEALGQLLRGDFSPSGRLPVTFYKGDEALPDFTDYRMDGRTYRFFEGEPLYPFGYGLGYTTFAYRDLRLPETLQKGENLTLTVTVENTGEREGLETVQIYASQSVDGLRTPRYQLCGLASVHLAPGESRQVTIAVPPYWLSAVTAEGERKQFAGEVTLYAGGRQPDGLSERLSGQTVLSGQIQITR